MITKDFQGVVLWILRHQNDVMHTNNPTQPEVRMSQRIEITEELMDRIYEAQKLHLIDVLQTNRNGDDGGDYITSALDCFTVIQEATCDQLDFASIDLWLNTPPDHDMFTLPNTNIVPLCNCASDGICDAIYELDCPALPKE